MLRNMLFKY